jgi:predicted MFS family arabinose efflux permease
VRRPWDRVPPLARGLALIALLAAVVVALSLEPVLAAIGGILQIAFFLAIAFFLFLVWRERRGDLEAWSDWNRRLFYGAIALAVVDVGLAIGLGFPSGIGAFAFLAVLVACAWVLVRVWRIEHRY